MDDERWSQQEHMQEVIKALNTIAESMRALSDSVRAVHNRLVVVEEMNGIAPGEEPPTLTLVPSLDEDD